MAVAVPPRADSGFLLIACGDKFPGCLTNCEWISDYSPWSRVCRFRLDFPLHVDSYLCVGWDQPVSVISVPRISLGGHLAAITSLMSNWLPGWLLWKGLGDYSCLLVDVHAFFVRNIYNEKKRKKKQRKEEKID